MSRLSRHLSRKAGKLSRQLFNPAKLHLNRILNGTDGLNVAKSIIPGAGLGVFAGEAIKAGVHLGYYKGLPCSPSEAHTGPISEKR